MTPVGIQRTAGAREARVTPQKRHRAAFRLRLGQTIVQMDSGVGDAVSEEVEAGKFLDADDAGADEDRGLALVVQRYHGKGNEGEQRVPVEMNRAG